MRKTLNNKIVSLIIVVSIILALAFFIIILNINRFSQNRELSQINYFLDSLIVHKNETIANEIFSGQREALTETLDNFSENEGVISGAIYSMSGEILASFGEQFYLKGFEDASKIGAESTFEKKEIAGMDLAVYTAEISIAGEKFGYIRLYYDISPIVKNSENMATIMLLLLGIKTVSLILILNMKIKKDIIKPIQRLERDMEKISEGDFDTDMEESNIYEIDKMRSVFDRMAKSLKETQGSLEELVNTRTKELTESKRMLSVVIDTMPTPVFYKDKFGRYTGCNTAFAELLGRSKSEIVGKTVFDVMEKEYASHIHKAELDMLKNPESQSYEGKFKTVFGVKDVIVNKASIVSEYGLSEGLVAVMSDITQRKEMERELKYDAKFQELIAEVSAGFISMDRRNMSDKIMDMLESMGIFFKTDRACMFREVEIGFYSKTHEWCRQGVEPLKHMVMPKEENSYFGKAISSGEPLVMDSVESASSSIGLEISVLKKYGVKAFLGVPILIDGKPEGLLGISMADSERAWSKKEVSLLKVLVNVLIDALEKKNIEDQLKKSNMELKKLSVTDKLTQIYNRLKIDEVLDYELEKCRRNRMRFAIILFDIDDFKSINDTLGHSVGDTVLVELSKILKMTLRKTDTLGRWGGEEFIAICPETDLDGAIIAAEKIRAEIESHSFEKAGRVTCSFGVTDSSIEDTGNSIVARADEALYRAKKRGKNRVEFK